MSTSPFFMSTTVDDLTNELLVEVLHRIPLESALTCKLVCKRWWDLISTSYFGSKLLHRCNLVSTRNPQDFSFLFHYIDGQTNKFQLATLTSSYYFIARTNVDFLSFLPCYRVEDEIPVAVVAVQDDLMLCSKKWRGQKIYYVCNPFVKQWVKLPPAPSSRPLAHVGFVCDQLHFKHGQDNRIRACRFRVIRIPRCNTDSRESFEIEIFSSEDGIWTQLVVPCSKTFFPSDISMNTCVATGNKLYWWDYDKDGLMVLDPFSFSLDRAGNLIHTDSNLCTFIDCPSGLNVIEDNFQSDGIQSLHLGVSSDRLKLVVSLNAYNPFLNHVVVVWELKEDNQWYFDFSLKMLRLLSSARERALSRVFVLGFHPIDPNILYFENGNQVIECNSLLKLLRPLSNDTYSEKITYIGDVHRFLKPFWPIPVRLMDVKESL